MAIVAVSLALATGPFQIHAAKGDPRGFIECNVPTATYPDIATALAGPCDRAILAAGEYAEDVLVDRAFTIRGPSSPRARIRGTVQIDTAAQVELENVDVEAGPDETEIFSDGFESGTTAAWSG